MNTIEQRLQAVDLKPRRQLKADFTANTLSALDKCHPDYERRPKWKEYIIMKYMHKPAFAVLTMFTAIAIGGSAYAAVGGAGGIRALFGGEHALPGGGRIVKVVTHDCPQVNAFNVANPQRTANDTYYYKVKSDSPLSNDQVIAIVQGNCDADAEAHADTPGSRAMTAVLTAPLNSGKIVAGAADSVVTYITPDSITVRSTINKQTFNQAFTHLDPELAVVTGTQVGNYAQLHVGDHVSVYYRASGEALDRSETIAPNQIDASAQTVVMIYKLSPAMQRYYQYQQYNHVDFEQVAPCGKTAIGYCTIDQL